MLKAVIIDDEYYFRQSLKKKIPWQDLEIEISGEANNGEDALELIIASNPDIALIDINMPIFNGIELTEKIREAGLDTAIILITGYSEFEYAQRALRQGVTNYLLKPVVQEELLTSITSLRNRILLEREESRQIDLILLSRKIGDILNGTSQEFSLLQFPEGSTIQVIAIDVSMNGGDAFLSDFNSMFMDISNGAFPVKSAIDMNGFYTVIIGRGENEVDTRFVNHCFSLLSARIREKYESNVFVGIGRKYGDLNSLSASYREAVIALKKAILHESTSSNVYEEKIGPSLNQNYLDQNRKRELIREIRLRNSEKVTKYVDDLFASLLTSEASEQMYKAYSYDLILSAIEFCSNEEFLKDRIKDLNDVFIKIEGSLTINELKELLLNSLGSMTESFPHREANKQVNLIYKMKTYIMENAFDPNFAIQDIADFFGMNYHYTCTLFKNETKETLNDYIRELRMQKARDLLKNTNKNISTIAFLCGYKDQYYFSRAFKKHFNAPPSEMR